MLQVTLNVFSGRENPSWVLDDNEAKELLKEISNNRGIVTEIGSGYQGLGYRGITLEALTDEVTEQYNLPYLFKIANGASLYESKGLEVAERLIQGLSRTTRTSASGIAVDFNQDLQTQLLNHLRSLPILTSYSEVDAPQQASSVEVEPSIAKITCNIEFGTFNPNFWNDPAHIRKNNCYNYATNRRTDTFAQPGRATGKYPYPMDCASVSTASLSDGLHKRYNCFPDTEKPRYLVAMVVAPGVDYHWYRKQQEGFWGHKPGGTPAKNVDNSGHIVYNPETCDRTSGWPSYTQFCGYFYTAKSIKVQ